MSNDLTSRVAIIETKIDSHNKRLEEVEENRDLIIKFSHFLELQTDHNKKMEEYVQNSNSIMSSMNSEISSIKHKVEDVQEDVNNVGVRVGTLENEKKEKAIEKKLNVKATIKWVGGILATIIGAYILSRLGLK